MTFTSHRRPVTRYKCSSRAVNFSRKADPEVRSNISAHDWMIADHGAAEAGATGNTSAFSTQIKTVSTINRFNSQYGHQEG
jgi:hypothetical protein